MPQSAGTKTLAKKISREALTEASFDTAKCEKTNTEVNSLTPRSPMENGTNDLRNKTRDVPMTAARSVNGTNALKKKNICRHITAQKKNAKRKERICRLRLRANMPAAIRSNIGNREKNR